VTRVSCFFLIGFILVVISDCHRYKTRVVAVWCCLLLIFIFVCLKSTIGKC